MAQTKSGDTVRFITQANQRMAQFLTLPLVASLQLKYWLKMRMYHTLKKWYSQQAEFIFQNT